MSFIPSYSEPISVHWKIKIMQSKSKFSTLAFTRKNKANSQGKSPIYFRIVVDGKPAELSTKHYIDENNWNSERGRVKGNSEIARTINHTIESLELKVHQQYNELLVKGKLITALLLKNKILGIEEKKYTLINLFELHTDEIRQRVGLDYAKGTYKTYLTTLRHLKEFVKRNYLTDDIAVQELNYKFITDFELYLKTVADNAQNGMLKHIQRLCKVVNIAVKNDWLDKDPFAKYEARKEKTNRDFLTAEELHLIEQKQFGLTRLDTVRDTFLFTCYTGLAYSDIKYLKPDNIRRGIDGEYWLFTNRRKTNIPSNIPLLPQALQIIEKYRNHPQALNQDTILPVLSNQRLNSYLKEIADLCGITKNISFHMGRHTFATTITLTNNVPIETVSKMLGHTNLKTTQIYAKVVEKKVSEDMMKLREKMKSNKRVEDLIRKAD